LAHQLRRSPQALTFTSSQWQTPQTLTATATADAARATIAILQGSSNRINLTLNSADTLYQNLPTNIVHPAL
jgi:hypothetical protein